ncbi:carboxymuconolactone decarboxylase family protein [Aldersonia sp. NBC_00410]|uniref:carboxymuconolactone decarboxylase family protein n=1 Tax=Aldersonia sp. NBC_00410 TaxID=2975954 RepID=UPI002255B898|nr:carboxymuconolactone decarboxylase family protein [Aldersonia sp. NBC_00410]MCX5045417.1 carboxymuconolactone decarboxylase family protein [Aldersonia sp. NBC_00410]
MARIAPISRREWAPKLVTYMSEYRAKVKGDRNNEGRPGGANLLGTLAVHPDLARSFLEFNGHILYGATISARVRELLVLRVASVRQADYEWAQHTLLAGDAGLTPEEIARVTDGPDAVGWSPSDRSLLRAADEMVFDGFVSAPTWQELAAEYDDRQLMDIVFTVGAYELLAKALRTFGVEPEPDLVPYLPVRG